METRLLQFVAGLERREFVFVLLLLSTNKSLLQETLRQVPATHAERDCQAEHQGSESDSKSNQHALFCYSHLLKGHGQYKDSDDRANGNTQQAGRRQVGIHCG